MANELSLIAHPFFKTADKPTQVGGPGVMFDFNQGARVLLEDNEAGWNVKLYDVDADTLLYHWYGAEQSWIMSKKTFYVKFKIEVYSGTELVLEHIYDCTDKLVVIYIPVGTLGDNLAWFPYADEFRKKYGANVTVVMPQYIIDIVKDEYPELSFMTAEEAYEAGLPEKAYATYNLGLFFEDKDLNYQPTDFRMVGLQKTIAYILGVEPVELKPRITLKNQTRPFEEPYVCIAVQSTAATKFWNNPAGWWQVVTHLKSKGLRVICIDKDHTFGHGLVWNAIPHDVEDFTGLRPLEERAWFLQHCELFVGLSSGLSWLAWAAGAKVVMISGFTHPTNEFYTPYRAINWHACNSCWNDPAFNFIHDDFLWCPRHQNTERHFECSRLISSTSVIALIDKALAD